MHVEADGGDEATLGGPCPQVESALRRLDAAGALGAAYLTDGEGRISWVSRGFVELTGYTADQARGRRRTELVTGPFVGSRAFAELDEQVRTAQAVVTEFPTRTASGRPYWAALEVRPIVADVELAPRVLCRDCDRCDHVDGSAGRVAVRATVGREHDVTARRAAEERARQALSRAESLGLALRLEKHLLTSVLTGLPQLVWWKSADGRYLGCNAAFLAARGLTSLADVIGRLESQLDVGDDFGAQVGAAEADVLAGRRSDVEVPATLTGADGESIRLLVTLSSSPTTTARGATQDAAGRAAVIGVAADVTRVSALERQLAQSQRLDSIGRLAAGVAHEINTPIQYVSDNTRFVLASVGDALEGLAEIDALARPGAGGEDGGLADAVRSCLQRLDLPFLREEVPAALTQAMEGLERVAQVVRAMKVFSDPSAGLVDSDVNDLVTAAVQVTENRWRDVADTEWDLDPEAGRAVCFASDLRQAVLQLLVNAAQAIEDRLRENPAGPRGRIRVATRRVPTPSGPEVRILIGDDGVGMPPDVVQRAFDPFFTTRDVGQGSGQGLSFAHATVVAKHGGRLEVDSEPGRGTTFTIAVPVGVLV